VGVTVADLVTILLLVGLEGPVQIQTDDDAARFLKDADRGAASPGDAER
jgi:hypothetical protein